MRKTICIVFLCLFSFAFVSCGNKGIKVPFDSDATKLMRFEEVGERFVQAGFSDIEYKCLLDLNSDNLIAEGLVEKVTVDGVEFFEKGQFFPKEAHIVIEYHSILRLEVPLSLTEIQSFETGAIKELFDIAGFSNVSFETVYDIDPDESEEEFVNEVTINGESSFSKGDEVPFDSKINIICHYPFSKYTLTFELNCVPNLIFNKYDINIYIDDKLMDTLPHGNKKVYSYRIPEGEFKLTFSTASKTSYSSDIVFMDFDSDIDASFKLYIWGSSVEVRTNYIDRKRELAEGQVKLSKSASEYKGINYQDAINMLKEEGFSNIDLYAYYDVYLGIFVTAGAVDSVSIDENSSFKKGDVFDKNAKIKLVFHEDSTKDPEYIESQRVAQEKAEKEKAEREKAALEKAERERLEEERVKREKEEAAKKAEEGMPLISGTNVDELTSAVRKYGLKETELGDEDFGYGCFNRELWTDNWSMSFEMLFSTYSKTLIGVNVIPHNMKFEDQKDFIFDVLKYMVPQEDYESVLDWVKKNIEKEASTVIGSIDYQIFRGGANQIIFEVNNQNWMEWDSKMEKLK